MNTPIRLFRIDRQDVATIKHHQAYHTMFHHPSDDIIEMSQDSFIENKNRLLESLNQVTVLDDSFPPELIAESEVCEKCPRHSGEIELCEPIGSN